VQDYPEFAEDKFGFIPVPVFSFVVPVEWWRLEIGYSLHSPKNSILGELPAGVKFRMLFFFHLLSHL